MDVEWVEEVALVESEKKKGVKIMALVQTMVKEKILYFEVKNIKSCCKKLTISTLVLIFKNKKI